MEAGLQMMRWRNWWWIACMAVSATGARAAPPTSVDTVAATLAGSELQVDVYRPQAGSTQGAAIVAHGWTRSRARHSDLGRAMAEAGIVAIIPDLPNVIDLWGNGEAIVDLARQLEAGAFGLPGIAPAQLVLVGTSAGGLATLLATARLPGVAGWVGLDPVDRTGTGRDAASRLAVPAIVLLGDASGCNLFGSGRTLARALPRVLRTQKFDGATHCDFEAPTNNLCRMMCGGSSDAMQERIRHDTVEATLELLALAAKPTAPARAAAP